MDSPDFRTFTVYDDERVNRAYALTHQGNAKPLTTYPEGRVCAHCTTKLSRYNAGPICDPCTNAALGMHDQLTIASREPGAVEDILQTTIATLLPKAHTL